MLVIDASALLELLLNTHRAPWIAARAFSRDETVHAPHLIDIEVTQVMRRYVRLHAISPSRATQSLDDLAQLPIERYPHLNLVPEVWRLRDTMSAYDATYVALAAVLRAPLLTCDAKLAAAGNAARVELVPN